MTAIFTHPVIADAVVLQPQMLTTSKVDLPPSGCPGKKLINCALVIIKTVQYTLRRPQQFCVFA